MINTNDIPIIDNGLLILESLSLELDNDKKDSLLTVVVGSGDAPHLQPLLLNHLNNQNLTQSVRTLAMSCLTCVVMKTKTKFIPFLVFPSPPFHPQDQTIPIALSILQTRDEDALLFRRRALEFLNKVIHHCGYDYVSNSMDYISNQIAALLGDGDTSFAETAFIFFKAMAGVVVVDDPKYMPALRMLAAYLPVMIELVRSDNGRCVVSTSSLTLFRSAREASAEGQRRVRASRRAV